MDNKPSVSCRQISYSVDHNVIHEDKEQEEAVIDAYQDESEWADRSQAAANPDFISQKK